MGRTALHELTLAGVQDIAKKRGLDVAGKSEFEIHSIIAQDDCLRDRAARNASHLQELHQVISALNAAQSPFVCVGSLPLDPSSPIAILVGSGPISEVSTTYTPVHFPLKNEAALQPLLEASKQASFGRGHQDILDPTYRRALVLHSDRFVVAPTGSLEPHALGIVDSIRETLFPAVENDGGSTRRIVAVLDKLNVYAEGDFFKGHVDTPKSPDMFGTLLINLPASHEGGQLIVRSPENQMSSPNDVGASRDQVYMTNWGKDTGLEWVAFFSDCEHEVLPVTRGKRVTLSYTLSFERPMMKHGPVDVEALAGSRDLAREKLVDTLKAPGILRKGRSLCFHLQHKYPLDPEKTPVSSIVNQLKGRDAVIYHALQASGASVTLHLVIFSDQSHVPVDDTDRDPDSTSNKVTIGGVDPTPSSTPMGRPQMLAPRSHQGPRTFSAVTGSPLAHYLNHSYISYGNESVLCTDYGSICIIANVPGEDVNAPWGPLVENASRLDVLD
ncbi:hypothetical protein BS47DRAFT_1341356 [Hydnum rufescens UP504]|uniref:Fe2OG dioxygenase domain-containing protein n=1 Tax=Hydnum rufescens UP504 TaxID=1448309 RepID=A0A9P6B498_9AGAM|nr:hypothetical protein BS47DRAFT_1341356 [Hydnum rufescens UP504]